MKFSEFSEYLEKLEATSSRLSLIEILSELFKKTPNNEIDEIVYLIQGRIAPFYAPIEIGMAEKNVASSVGIAYGSDKDKVLSLFTRLGALGVLDDITTTQSAAIFELHKLDKKLSMTDLFVKGYNIGREHIASLVNTLILAYAGASLGLFVIFVLNPNQTPIWVIINSENISEEIVRAIAGSIGLILAVPITTLVASYIAKRTK